MKKKRVELQEKLAERSDLNRRAEKSGKPRSERQRRCMCLGCSSSALLKSWSSSRPVRR
jgi:hypothetical protein